MGWERYLMPHWWTVNEANELESRLQHMIDAGRRRRQNESARIRELEADLGRVALLARSLAELCLKKGVFTRDQLKSELFAVDMDDGVGDRSLDPKVVMPGETKLAPRESKAKPNPPRKRR